MWSAILSKTIAWALRGCAAVDAALLAVVMRLCCVGLLLLAANSAVAEPFKVGPEQPGLRRPAIADELFTRGKERLAANDFAAACPLLAQSYALDPATGSLLALALCHERQGKLASALREFNEVVERARSEQRSDREQAARARIFAIQGRVSTLVLQSAQKPDGLIVRVNDVAITTAQLGQPLPSDGGFVLVEAEAMGKQPWRKHVTLADSGDVLTVTIPALEPEQKASAPAPGPTPAPKVVALRAQESKPRRKSRFSALEIGGITLLAAGGAGAVIAVGYTAAAVSKNNDSKANCDTDLCTPKGREIRQDARRAGDVATVAVVAATAVSAAGLITFLVGRSRNRDRRVSASGWIAPGGGGAAVAGRF